MSRLGDQDLAAEWWSPTSAPRAPPGQLRLSSAREGGEVRGASADSQPPSGGLESRGWAGQLWLKVACQESAEGESY